VDNIFKIIGIIFFIGTGVVVTSTIIIYGFFTDWRHEEISRHTFNYLLAFTLAFDYISATFYLPWIPRDRWIQTVIYGYIFFAVVWRLIIIVRYRFFNSKPLKIVIKERVLRRKVSDDHKA